MPAITKTGSSLIRTAHSDARAGLAPSESPRPPNEVKGQAHPNEPSHTRPSASSHEPPFPPEHVASAVNADSLSLPQSLDRSSARIQGNETLTPDKKGGNWTTASNEPKIHQEVPTADTYSAQRRKPESSTLSTHVPDIKRQPKATLQSSVGPTSSSSVGRGYDLGATHLPDSSEPRGNTGRSDAISSLRTTEAPVTPQVSLSTQNQARPVVSTPSNIKLTSSITKSLPRPPTVVGDSRIVDSPFLFQTTSSLGSAPITPTTSQEAKREGEMRPGTVTPSKPIRSIMQPGSAAGHLASRSAPPTKTLPETGDDTPSRLLDDHHHTETRDPSLVQVDSSQEVKNRPHAKPSDHTQPSAHAVPSMIKVPSNMGKERGSQAQPGHPIPQLQHPQRESGGMAPNQQHRTDPLRTRQAEISSSEHATTIEVPSFPHFRPVIAYIPVHPGEISNPERSPPPPYEPILSPGVPVVQEVQEAAPSRSGTRASSEVRDEPKKLPASLVQEVPHHPDDPGHIDRSAELKQLLLSTRNDAVAAVCPPPDHPQSVEVYRSDRSQMASTRGVRQFAALSSPKIRDRSRSGSSVEQDNDTITLPPVLEKPHDPPIIDIQEVKPRGTGSFDDEDRGRRPQAKSDEDGRSGQKDDDARGSQASLKQQVPQVRVIPPTPRASVVPPEILRPAHSDIPPVPIRPAHTSLPAPSSPPRNPASGRPAESSPRRKKKGILSRICPCFG